MHSNHRSLKFGEKQINARYLVPDTHPHRRSTYREALIGGCSPLIGLAVRLGSRKRHIGLGGLYMTVNCKTSARSLQSNTKRVPPGFLWRAARARCNCCMSRIPAPIVPVFPSRREPDSSLDSLVLLDGHRHPPTSPRPPSLRLLAPPMIHAPTTASRLPSMAGADAL